MTRWHVAAALFLLAILLALAPPFHAEMRDSTASVRARALFGDAGMIDMRRSVTDGYWTKRVGYWDGLNFVVMGQASNSWDDAFAAIPAGAVVVPPITANAITLGPLVLRADNVAYDQFRADQTALAPGASTMLGPAFSAWLRNDAESRLGDALIQMRALNPTAADAILLAHGVTLNGIIPQ